MKFKLTYATMFDPPAEMDARFEAALAEVRAGLGAHYLLHIDGQDCPGAASQARHTPIDQRVLLGHFSRASSAQAEQASRVPDHQTVHARGNRLELPRLQIDDP